MNHFRTRKNIFNHTSKQMTEFLYFELLRLTVMYKVYESIDVATEYASRTIIRPLNMPFTLHDTDLKGILLYFDEVSKGSAELERRDQIMMNRVNINMREIYAYLRSIRQGHDISHRSKTFLGKMATGLMIDSPRLRAMATLVNKWQTLKSSEMKKLFDSIDKYGTLYMRKSYLTKHFHSLKNNSSRLFSDKEEKKSPVSAGDAIMGILSGLALKWSIDSRRKNKAAFDRLRSDTKNHDYRNK